MTMADKVILTQIFVWINSRVKQYTMYTMYGSNEKGINGKVKISFIDIVSVRASNGFASSVGYIFSLVNGSISQNNYKRACYPHCSRDFLTDIDILS